MDTLREEYKKWSREEHEVSLEQLAYLFQTLTRISVGSGTNAYRSSESINC